MGKNIWYQSYVWGWNTAEESSSVKSRVSMILFHTRATDERLTTSTQAVCNLHVFWFLDFLDRHLHTHAVALVFFTFWWHRKSGVGWACSHAKASHYTREHAIQRSFVYYATHSQAPSFMIIPCLSISVSSLEKDLWCNHTYRKHM